MLTRVNNIPRPMPNLVDMKEIAARLQICKRTLQRWTRDGNFPPPIRLSSRSLRWRWSDVQAHLAKLQGGKL